MNPIDEAINEQLQGYIHEPGVERGVRGGYLTIPQMLRSRRRTEDIFIEMADKMKTCVLPEQRSAKKRKKRRRRRRGAKVLVETTY